MFEAQYYKNIKNKKIAIFGITPPPLGGVSVHIDRIAKKFTENNNQVYHFKTEFRGRRYLLIPYLFYAAAFLIYHKIDIIYYHSSYLPNSFTEILFLSRIKKFLKIQFILIEHNCRHMYRRNKKDLNKINKALKNTDLIVFMGKLPENSYIDNININKIAHTIDNAFLPPNESKEQEIINTYPKKLNIFLQNKSPILLANASILPKNTEADLYGFDKSINALIELKKSHPNIGLILALSQIGNETQLQYLFKKIESLKLADNICFLIWQKELWPLFKKIDIFLRPTTKMALV